MLRPMSGTRFFALATVMAILVAALTLGLLPAPAAHAQTSAGPARPMITQQVVETNAVRLVGNTRPEANAANDRGRVPDNLSMEHLLLQLRRPPAQEQALNQLIDQLHNPASAKFHQWLKPSEFGAQFGPAASDIAQVTAWLQRHGFQVNTVYPSGMTIDFSGTAGQVFTAFRTEIHYLEARGATHIANMSDPQIPAALAPAVVGIVSLHDFMPRPRLVRKPVTEYTVGCGTSPPTTCYPVTPADIATIYNFNPLFTAGTSGQNQTIYLIEDSNLYTTDDWTAFRAAFGLSGYAGASLSTVHPAPPSGSNNCSDPGVNIDGGEAILDAEYASAAAPGAAIVMATCADTNATFGGLFAIQNLINAPNPPAIISVSYGECEASNGASGNAAFSAIFQQGVAEGTSIFVAAGDEGAGGCDYNASVVTHGIGVNAFASTPYNVAVGGTDFGDTYSGSSGTYWSAGNTATYGSANSYIPEIPWNDSCASRLLATFLGYATTYGTSGFCNSATGKANFLNNAGGSGGPSGCATGTPSISGVVGGTCKGYAKPSWQTGVVGIPSDGVRGLPDVSLFAANGLWGHYYVYCYSDPSSGYGGAPCTGDPSWWSLAGGTSFSTPLMAGLQALVNQSAGGPQGNPNYRYYELAAGEYGAGGSSACNSSNGNAAGGSCIFYDVTVGDIDVNCTGSHNCYRPSGTNGVLSTSNSSYAPAYPATTGWDFATGLGTVNAYNLVTSWSNAGPLPALQVAPPANIAASGPQGGPFSPPSFAYTLSATSESAAYAISGVPSWLTASATSGTASSGTTVTFTVNANAKTLAADTYSATITFADTDTGQGTQTRTATLAVSPPALQVSPATSIAALGAQGGPFSPSSFSYTLNASSGSLQYAISNVPSWLTASSVSGTVTTSNRTITFSVNSSAKNLGPNVYVGSIAFTNASTGQGNTSRVATLTVNPKEYTITVSASPRADGTVGGGGTFVAGASPTVTATPNGGHSFVHWTQNGRVVSTSESYTFTLNANVALVADFK
jgi:hypothetical protein